MSLILDTKVRSYFGETDSVPERNLSDYEIN